ncbi:unnamed protein product, partial [Candidula unifasciata]
YSQHIMPPPVSMGFVAPNAGKMSDSQMPGQYPQYSAQYPQGSFGRPQPNIGGMSGSPVSGPVQNYPGSQASMYQNGPSQMSAAPMYGNMPGMVRQQGYVPNSGPYSQGSASMGAMMNSQYAGYNSHMPIPGQHSMQQPPGAAGQMPLGMSVQQGSMTAQQHSSSSNKAAQAAHAAMMAAASSVGPRMAHMRASVNHSRGMFGQPSGGPLAQMNSMTNSPNLGSPSLNSMSHAVDQLVRKSSSGLSPYMGNSSTSTPSPVPKAAHSPATMTSSSTPSSMAHSVGHGALQTSPTPASETHESLSRPSSTTAHHPDYQNSESTMGSDSSGGMPSDSTSVDSGFHSSDQGDKTSDSLGNLIHSRTSPPISGPSANGEPSRTLENISPPNHASHSHQHRNPMQMHHQPQHFDMGPESKMPYSNDSGVPLPPSAISSMPSSSSSFVTTSNIGPLLTSVTQSIASPVTSVSTSAPHHYSHPHPHHMGPLGGSPHMMSHMMGPGPQGMMSNGMPLGGIMSAGQIGGPGHMPQNMAGSPHIMGGPNMNVHQNGPMMGLNRPHMGHGSPVMSSHPGINSSNGAPMPHMGPMLTQQQQMNCMPHVGNNNSFSDEPPEKKRKTKELDGQTGPCSGSAGPLYSEEPSSPGALKSTSDLSKLFELGPEPDRRPFLERILGFLEESGQPVTALPIISKTPLDLYKLYFCVREKGGFEEVTRSKKWRDVCTVVNIGTSASAAFTLKKNYIRYLFNYECKYDRGGINPAPILAQMEALLAHKREQKSKRAPSPGSNSNESFRPPSVPSSDSSSYQQQPAMPPPYMQNLDGGMPNPLVSGGVMMGSPGPNCGVGSMMGGPQTMGPSGMMGSPGPNMMHGQQGMMPPNVGTGNVMGSHMMPGGPAGYGGQMMQHAGGSVSHAVSSSACGPSVHSHGMSAAGPMPATGDSISVQDPFSDESGYLQQRGGQLPPALSPQLVSVATSTHMASTSSRPVPSAGYTGPEQQVGGFPPNSSGLNDPMSASGDHFPFGQQFERPDRFDQSSPSMGVRPAVASPGMPPLQQPPQQPGDSSSPQMYPGPRFPGPHQPVGIRPPPGSETSGPYPQQGPLYQSQGGPYPGPQYPNYSQTAPGSYPGPRPTSGVGGPYGTPSKRFADEHAASGQFADWSSPGLGSHVSYPSAPPERQAPSPDDRIRDGGQWSPMQRSRMSQSGPGYLSPAPPSTPPMGQYVRQVTHVGSPQTREMSRIPATKVPPAYGGLPATSLTKKEVTFPPDCVESVHISTTKRKKLTSKDIAPFEPWRLMLSLKSGLLAESTWALDTLNILLYDDSTYGYFGLNTLPGLLEVLTEHLRHCLMQMFVEFQDLEGLSHKRNQKAVKSESSHSLKSQNQEPHDDKVFHFSGPNYTMMSRKSLPVKMDHNPADSCVLEVKDWDMYTNFDTKPDYWLSGRGDITDHILTHLESDNSSKFLSGQFRKKRTREQSSDTEHCPPSFSHSEEDCENVTATELLQYESMLFVDSCKKEMKIIEQTRVLEESRSLVVENAGRRPCDSKTGAELHNTARETFSSAADHSNLCNGDDMYGEKSPPNSDFLVIKNEPLIVTEADIQNQTDIKTEQMKLGLKDETNDEEVADVKVKHHITEKVNLFKCNEKCDNVDDAEMKTVERESSFDGSKPYENGDIEQPKLSPIANHLNCDSSLLTDSDVKNTGETPLQRAAGMESDNCSNSSPPVLKAEGLDSDEDVTQGSSEPANITEGNSGAEISTEIETNAMKAVCSTDDRCKDEADQTDGKEEEEEISTEQQALQNCCSTTVLTVGGADDAVPNDGCVSESEELSASIVSELLKQDESIEEEAFHRDDPPLCVTPESREELGRRCVCISNIIRSLSCVPGNEARISRYPGIMRVLGRLLLLHHSHPAKLPRRKLPCGDEEEEREEPPRIYDDEHWWWDYLDQLRENTLVTLANICGDLNLGNFSEQVCYPLIEGLLHWVICPASVARDPLPTLPPGSVLSPQRLVLEALCKLCIHEINVDLVLATGPVKRIIELFNVLVHLLADRSHQITREFSVVLLSLLVTGESTAARAVALQHPSVSLLVDFLEVAEQNAQAVINNQGIEVLQSNPEIMGTSLDMLRRAATILLHMARVPDNRKMFIHQQSRLLNLVMSHTLDQSVSNTLSEVLFECSQCS